MSYVHTTEVIRKISSPTGEVLFVYPANTVLDLIIPDLWPNIINNIHNDLFAIGKHDKMYPDYHLVTKDECYSPKFIYIFKDYCQKNNGIISMDDLLPGVLTCDENNIIVNDKYCLSCINNDNYNGIMKKDTISTFETIIKNHKEIMLNFDIKIVTYVNRREFIGLFIRNDYVF